MEKNEKIIRDSDVIAVFEIDEELAKELSDVLNTINVRHRLLLDLLDKPVKYAEVEKSILTLEDRRTELMNRIRIEFVPAEYRKEGYNWWFPGIATARNECWVKAV